MAVMMTSRKRLALLFCLALSCLTDPPSLAAQRPDEALLERYFREGEKALAEKRFAEAAQAYEKLSQLDPGTAEVHAKLGLIYYQQGQFSKAVSALRQASNWASKHRHPSCYVAL
jgi:tetratricopeptide (TPR) repeat protein